MRENTPAVDPEVEALADYEKAVERLRHVEACHNIERLREDIVLAERRLARARASRPGITPGPWEWDDNDNGNLVLCAGDAYVLAGDWGTGLVVRAGDRLYPLTPENANARLIVSAPDLLEACKLALYTLDAASTIDQVSETIRILRAVIAKATGEGE